MTKESKNQKNIFTTTEGNAWFTRNQKKILVSSNEKVERAKILNSFISDKDHILEIGCACGTNLNTLLKHKQVQCYGVDPSFEAVRVGSQYSPQLTLLQGTADELPFLDEQFEIVWFGFCLYLIDRKLLFKTITEADRVLKDNGILLITDFDPQFPSTSPYIHKKGLNSYKMDYSKLFLANPSYHLLEKNISCINKALYSPPKDIVSTWIMRKNISEAYITESNK
jgi:ubiquinone/menaquinone biosynthesis C-methylase UbiE